MSYSVLTGKGMGCIHAIVTQTGTWDLGLEKEKRSSVSLDANGELKGGHTGGCKRGVEKSESRLELGPRTHVAWISGLDG